MKSEIRNQISEKLRRDARMRTKRYQQFLNEITPKVEKIDDIAERMGIEKRNIHPLIRRAEDDGYRFYKTRVNGGLYTIQIWETSWKELIENELLADLTEHDL